MYDTHQSPSRINWVIQETLGSCNFAILSTTSPIISLPVTMAKMPPGWICSLQRREKNNTGDASWHIKSMYCKRYTFEIAKFSGSWLTMFAFEVLCFEPLSDLSCHMLRNWTSLTVEFLSGYATNLLISPPKNLKMKWHYNLNMFFFTSQRPGCYMQVPQ